MCGALAGGAMEQSRWQHWAMPLPALTSPILRLPPSPRRDVGGREDRQKARLMWLVEAMGVDAFRAAIEQRMGVWLRREVHVAYEDDFPRRDVLGIHPQKQRGLVWVGACIPVGRLQADDLEALADVAERRVRWEGDL